MRKTVILNSDEIITLNLLVKLNNEILLYGLTKDTTDALYDLQGKLIDIILKTI